MFGQPCCLGLFLLSGLFLRPSFCCNVAVVFVDADGAVVSGAVLISDLVF
jgi:hypothetical protein